MEVPGAVKEKLTGAEPVLISAKAGANGRLFGAVSTSAIASAAKEQLGVELDKHKIVIEQPIKAVGTYQLTVRLFEDVVAPLEVAVRPEK